MMKKRRLDSDEDKDKNKDEVLPLESGESWKKTIFISNIPFKADEQQLLTFLKLHLEKIINVELKRDHQGNFKGVALAHFPDEVSATEALHHDRLPLGGRPLFLSPYQPVPAHHRHSVVSRERNPCLLFVSHLPDHARREEIIKHFEGSIQVRVVPHKHIAYVQYETEEETARERARLDGSRMREVSIRVQISNPQEAKARRDVLKMVPRSLTTPKTRVDVPKLAPNDDNSDDDNNDSKDDGNKGME